MLRTIRVHPLSEATLRQEFLALGNRKTKNFYRTPFSSGVARSAGVPPPFAFMFSQFEVLSLVEFTTTTASSWRRAAAF